MRLTIRWAAAALALLAATSTAPAAADDQDENAGIFTAQLPEAGSSISWGQAVIVVDKPIDDVRVVEARLLEGNIDAFSARFTLTPVDGGTRTEIDFKIHVDPDIPLPSSVFSRENERAAGRTAASKLNQAQDRPPADLDWFRPHATKARR